MGREGWREVSWLDAWRGVSEEERLEISKMSERV